MMRMPTQNLKNVCNKSHRLFSEARIKSFSKAIILIDISTVLKETNPNAAYNVLGNLFMTKLKNFFPLQKTSKNKSSKSWFDSELEKLLDTFKNKKTYLKYLTHNSPILGNKSKTSSNSLLVDG